METFADELRNLVDSWRGRDGTSDQEIIEALQDEIDKLDEDNDF